MKNKVFLLKHIFKCLKGVLTASFDTYKALVNLYINI